jgi:hypothetical protein
MTTTDPLHSLTWPILRRRATSRSLGSYQIIDPGNMYPLQEYMKVHYAKGLLARHADGKMPRPYAGHATSAPLYMLPTQADYTASSPLSCRGRRHALQPPSQSTNPLPPEHDPLISEVSPQ